MKEPPIRVDACEYSSIMAMATANFYFEPYLLHNVRGLIDDLPIVRRRRTNAQRLFVYKGSLLFLMCRGDDGDLEQAIWNRHSSSPKRTYKMKFEPLESVFKP